MFSNQTKFNIETHSDVVRLECLITSIKDHHDIILSNNIENIRDRVIELNVTNRVERRKHIKNIRNKIKENKEKIDNMVCPRCNGSLVVKNGKYGSFVGCSNYPNCRFIKK